MSSVWQRQFGQLAIQTGLIDHRNYVKAVSELKRRRKRGQPVLLGQLLVELELMAPTDVEQLYEILLASPAIEAGASEQAPAERSLDTLAPGATVGRHRLGAPLGEGGMGAVISAHDPELERMVALKVVHGSEDPALETKFVGEARITGRLEHPSIVPVYELGRTRDGRAYFTMRRVVGRDLHQLLTEQHPREQGWIELLPAFGQVCDCISYAHNEGVIHRDLKPSNIMIGDFGEVMVMDWGLAKALGAPDGSEKRLTIDRQAGHDEASPLVTMDGAVVGTPAYMSPEQARGEVAAIDERSDVYALGAILHQLLTLKPPYEGASVWSVLAAVADGTRRRPSEVAPAREIPWELDAVVDKAMALDPEQRYASVAEMKRDLDMFLTGGVLSAARYSLWQRLRKLARRHSGVLAVVAVIVVVLGASALYVQRQLSRQQDERVRQLRIDRDKAALVIQRHRERSRALINAWKQAERKATETGEQRSARERMVSELLDAVSALERVLAALPEDSRASASRVEVGRLLGQLALVGGDYTLAAWSYRSLTAHGMTSRQLDTQLQRIEQARASAASASGGPKDR